MPPRLQRQKGLFMYLCYEKYGMQQAVEIGLLSRVMCSVLVFGSRMRSRNAHITLNVKSPISLPCCIIYY